MRECISCKYGRGLGSDVWCGHDPKGKESYIYKIISAVVVLY